MDAQTCGVECVILDRLVGLLVRPVTVAIQMEAWKTAKIAVVRLCGYLTFILECSVTTKTIKVASNHRGSTKLEFVKTAKLFIFFLSSFFFRRAISTLP